MTKTVQYYTAKFCAPCRALKPKFEKTVTALGLDFEYVDIEEQPERAYVEGVVSVPTIVAGDRTLHPASGPWKFTVDQLTDYAEEA